MAYQAMKNFIGSKKGKETNFKSGDIIEDEDVETWKNKEGLSSCRMIKKVPNKKKEEIPKDEIPNNETETSMKNDNGVFG